MTERLNGKAPWEFACDWYRVNDIEVAIHRRFYSSSQFRSMPTDVDSHEFAEWLTNQYRLAMQKGMQIMQQSMPEDKPCPRCGATEQHLASYWAMKAEAAKQEVTID